MNKRRLIVLSLFLPLILLAVHPASARLKVSQPTISSDSYTYTAPTSTATATPTSTATTTEAATATPTTAAIATTPAPAPTPTNLVSNLASQLDSLLKQLVALLTTQLQGLQQQLAVKLGQQPAATPPTTTATTTAQTVATSTAATSATATSTAAENKPPRVNIVVPSSGLELTAPASTDVVVSALDEDGSISQVEFFVGGNSLGVVKNPNGPWRVSWSGNAGNYTFTANATDDKGAVTASAPVELRVRTLSQNTGTFTDSPPTITIDGFGATATSSQSVSIVATASTYAGSISQVVFYKASSNTAGIIATDVASPFQVSTTMAVTGAWTLSATATNSQGTTKNSGSTTINIGPN